MGSVLLIPSLLMYDLTHAYLSSNSLRIDVG